MVLAAPLAGMIPLASLAAVLVLVAWNMAELDKFRFLFRAPRSDAAVLLATFLLTVLVDLNVAIQAGLLLAALLFMKRMIQVANVGPAPWLDHEVIAPQSLARRLAMPEVEIYEITGPFFFGVADRLKAVLDMLSRPPKVFILRMRSVPAIDATGLHALELFYESCRRQHTELVLSGVQSQPHKAMLRSGLADKVGPANVCHGFDEALERAQQLVDEAHGQHAQEALAAVKA
jgi:SulP family sulfate permease